jgi:purine-nucleoside phosphorylase
MNNEVKECVDYIHSITDFTPRAALILGSGLGAFSQEIDHVVCTIPYKNIPGFPISTVSGHNGKFIMGYIEEIPVICMDGRVHYYEGYTTDQVVLPVRVMRALGAEFLFITNASGGINSSFVPGTLALVRDHISLFVPNPLLGPNDQEEGVRFPDMSDIYDPRLRKLILSAADYEGISLETGVYCQLTGPSYESPAEIQVLKVIGADMVGMSTAMEAIVAKHAGMKIGCISLITNMAAGINAKPLSHEDVKIAGYQAEEVFKRLLIAAILTIRDY